MVREFSRARLAAVVAANVVVLAGMAAAFWYEDGRYSLPTPRPGDLHPPELGERIGLTEELAAIRRPGRPLLIHFANPACPCTEFNLEHVRGLQRKFGNRVDFVTALQTSASPEKARAQFTKLHLAMPVVLDRGGALGAALGVYSTPQAAILDAQDHLYFRGNYNRSRYCEDPTSEFARIALGALAQREALPVMPIAAAVAYGCPFPKGGRP
jgi:hypothetical protein